MECDYYVVGRFVAFLTLFATSLLTVFVLILFYIRFVIFSILLIVVVLLLMACPYIYANSTTGDYLGLFRMFLTGSVTPGAFDPRIKCPWGN